jgi:hypothetical protein
MARFDCAARAGGSVCLCCACVGANGHVTHLVCVVSKRVCREMEPLVRLSCLLTNGRRPRPLLYRLAYGSMQQGALYYNTDRTSLYEVRDYVPRTLPCAQP